VRRPSPRLIFLPDSFLQSRPAAVVALAVKYKLPAVYSVSAFARSGGLVTFGIEREDLFRRAAGYVDRILKGEKPSDLPVQMPSKFELVVNLRAAKSLGLTIPATVLARADEVIE
jgi:putative ABC transport system substrate-binding protein